ncbi:MAG TPA: hypothetical protein VIE67_00655 [Rudaea sp.]|jgi:hypothetical protein|uniref:hypothetical protein n=1 Tax=Rudaea sp. TaxID=2136325 RepID=UPI002F95F37A
MRRIVVLASGLALALSGHAADIAGRWQGSAQIPGLPLQLTVDLDRDASGNWVGSIIIPELAMKGQPLMDIAAHDAAVAFAIKGALVEAKAEPAKFEAQLDSDATMHGRFTQAGNSAPFTLKRIGPAQVDLPPRSTAVAKELEGQWVGEYELMGYPRHVTVTFTNHEGAPASVEFVIVGKKHNDLPVDFVNQSEGIVRIESHEIGINFEGRLRPGSSELAGTYEQGPIELPLVLHRPNGSGQ